MYSVSMFIMSLYGCCGKICTVVQDELRITVLRFYHLHFLLSAQFVDSFYLIKIR